MKNIIFKVFYILIIIYLIIFIPVLWGKRPLVVISGSMEPILKVGGILYYEKINLDDFKKDDILVYQLNEHIVSHRIVNINEYGFETNTLYPIPLLSITTLLLVTSSIIPFI